MWCLVWVQTDIHILPQSPQWYVRYHVLLDRVITAFSCICLLHPAHQTWMPYCWWFFLNFHLICLHLGFRSFCHFSHLSLPRLIFCWVSSLYGLLWHYTVWYSMAVLKIELRSPSLPCLWFPLTIQIETAQLLCHVQSMVAITMLEFDWDENEISV